jgi:hypothetical protein
MNLNDLPKKDLNKVSEDFFEKQFEKIIGKTLDLENWNLPGTKSIESQFKIPDGYWLKMEVGIRCKIHPQTPIKYAFGKTWQFATVLGTVLIFALSFLYLNQNVKSDSENWSASLDRLSSEELLAGIDIEKPEIKELTEMMAANQLTDNSIDFQRDDLNNQEIEESLENINSSDLINDLEIN